VQSGGGGGGTTSGGGTAGGGTGTTAGGTGTTAGGTGTTAGSGTATAKLHPVISTHPARNITTTGPTAKVVFRFSAKGAQKYRCAIDKGHFKSCHSPFTARVAPGKHTFSVEAVGSGGASKPMEYRFTVRRVRHH
jgi:hypothetical protein